MKTNWIKDFDKYTGHMSQFYKKSEENDKPTFENIKYHDSDIGRGLGLDRIAIHHIIIPPGHRSSLPHAESSEEEFVFVLHGNIDLWLNGYIYSLQQGHAVGFPAGTGVAHTFINNSSEGVELLIAGDKTKKDNLCAFPINPEEKKFSPIWWEDSPAQNIGPHNGLPKKILEAERGTSKPKCLLYCPKVERPDSFSYAGDNETFGEGFRITNKIGLQSLGIWYEYLPPNRRSSFPHAHKIENEFVLVLQGKPTVWLNGHTKDIGPGEFAAFPSNTGLAHTIINNTDEEIIYLCVGEATHFPDEKIHYPMNPLRNKECLRKQMLWTDSPQSEMGSHHSKPEKPFPDHLSLKLCNESDAEKVLEVSLQSPTYSQNVDGAQPTLEMAKHAITDGPVNTSEQYFKEFHIIYLNNEAIGLADLHAHHPESKTCYLGLLLIKESLFGQGLGRKCFDFIEDYIKRSFECDKIRLGISDDNDVTNFWLKMGFSPNGKEYPWQGEEKVSIVKEFDKVLPKL